jgi:hypothetical protein
MSASMYVQLATLNLVKQYKIVEGVHVQQNSAAERVGLTANNLSSSKSFKDIGVRCSYLA